MMMPNVVVMMAMTAISAACRLKGRAHPYELGAETMEHDDERQRIAGAVTRRPGNRVANRPAAGPSAAALALGP